MSVLVEQQARMMAKITWLRAVSECRNVEFSTFMAPLLMYNERFDGCTSIGITRVTNMSLRRLMMEIGQLTIC